MVNRMNRLFPTAATSILHFFYFKNYKTKQNRKQTGHVLFRYYSDDHIARDHIDKDITACNIEEPEQKYRLGMVSNRLREKRGRS